jgi:hypothetical protein
VWHVVGAGEGGAGDGAGTGGDLTHRLLSRLEPAVRVSSFTPHLSKCNVKPAPNLC